VLFRFVDTVGKGCYSRNRQKGGERQMDQEKTLMTQGCIWKILLRFAFPLFLGNLFQQLYNAVDSLVVGNFCGDTALAAVSSSGSLCHLLIGFFQGVFVGASVIISRRYGARDEEGVEKAVHTTVVFALIAGVLISVLGIVFTPTLLEWMGTPESVMVESVRYFRIYCAGMLGLVLYNTSNGIFQALGDSRHPLYYLIVSSVTNVVLDLLFVGVFGMGVSGAALATVLGQLLSAVLGFVHLMSGRFVIRISIKKLRPDLATLKNVVRLGLPSGVQNSVISIANVVVQTNINAFGDTAMAGCGSYTKVEGFVFLPIVSLMLALTTFVGQNLGAGKVDRVKRGAWTGIAMAVIMAELFGAVFYLYAPQLIGLFSDSPEVIAYGVRQAKVEAFFYAFLAFAHGSAAALRGAGKAMVPMVVMLGSWCVLRIVYITVMVKVLQDIAVVFSAYPVTWGVSCIFFAAALLKGDWLRNSTQKL